MNIRSMDLNLILVASALYRTRNVSRASEELGLSQSAVSHALARLRQAYGDPLFVRSSKGVVPTEFALSIESDVLELVRRAEALAGRKSAFDPATARGRLTVASTDYVEAVLFPGLARRLEREAPGVQLSLRPTSGDLPRRELEDGRIDLAVAGFYSRLPEGFFQARAGSETFSCAVRKGHPLARKGRISKEDYFRARHALITLQGDFEDGIEADDLAETSAPRSGARSRRKGREVVYGSYSFTGPGWVLAKTDLVLTAPTRLLESFAELFPIAVLPSPVDMGKLELKLVWHARAQKDPLRAWFRKVFREECERVLDA